MALASIVVSPMIASRSLVKVLSSSALLKKSDRFSDVWHLDRWILPSLVYSRSSSVFRAKCFDRLDWRSEFAFSCSA